jgi:hypothetical protein
MKKPEFLRVWWLIGAGATAEGCFIYFGDPLNISIIASFSMFASCFIIESWFEFSEKAKENKEGK